MWYRLCLIECYLLYTLPVSVGTVGRGRSRGGSLGLLEPPFWLEIFHFHKDFGLKVRNFHVQLTFPKMPKKTITLSGNPAYSPGGVGEQGNH